MDDTKNFDETITGGGDEQGMQISADLIRGHINTIILRCLYDEDKYGYDIINEIEKKSGGLYVMKQPTLYSALKRLESLELVDSYYGDYSNGGQRKYFRLTEKGRKAIEQDLSEWEYSRTIIDSLISDGDAHYDFSFITKKQNELVELKKSLELRESALEEQKTALNNYKNELQRERSLLSVQSANLNEQRSDVNEYKAQISAQKEIIEQKENELSSLQISIEEKEQILSNKIALLDQKEADLTESKLVIEALRAEILNKNNEINRLQSAIQNIDGDLTDKNEKFVLLSEEKNNLETKNHTFYFFYM